MIGQYQYLYYRKYISGLPACVRSSAVGWWKSLDNEATTTQTISGLLDFDGTDDRITFGSHPDVSGSKIISFKAYLPSTSSGNGPLFIFKDSNTDFIRFELSTEGDLFINTNNTNIYSYSDSSLIDNVVEVEITKTTGVLSNLSINRVDVSFSTIVTATSPDDGDYIGYESRSGGAATEYYYGRIWDLNINYEHRYDGQPYADQDSAWIDRVGTLDGTVNGTPSTTSVSNSFVFIEESIGTRIDRVYFGQYLDSSSGQINLYRSGGTYDYIDPSTGNSVTGNAIPGDGLITIPVNGICEITTSDGSRYPICERAGDVLHDILENSIHISVSTPSWSETLYGSDYLNQCGFLDKATSDALGLPWTTVVNEVTETLDDNCLVPLSQWAYQALLDSLGEIITDSEEEIIYARTNT